MGPQFNFQHPPSADAVISALTQEHAENIRVWKTYTDTEKALLSATTFVVPTNPGSTVQLANLVGVGVCFPDTDIFGVFLREG